MQKIAILGGGIGALTTAAELTSDPSWKEKYEITIYQMGWRLGGKGASGRNQQMSDRIQEHGIHLWMGFYENAFHLIRQAYNEAHQNNLMPTSPFTDARKAFSPMNYTPMMEQYKGQWKVWGIDWTPWTDEGRKEFPGDPALFEQKLEPPTPLGFARLLLSHVTLLLDQKKVKHPILVRLYQDAAGHLANSIGSSPVLPADTPLPRVHTGLHRITAFLESIPHDVNAHAPELHADIAEWLKAFNDQIFRLVSGELEKDDDLRRFFIIVDTALAVVVGMIKDEVLTKGFLAIEQYDFIEWLDKHGCRHSVSPLTVGMYDACFAYQKGEVTGRKMAAGSTLYGALRLMFTYKGALMWWMNAGMGETIMSPLYLVLKNRGVKFKFFHKVKNVGLSADKRSIDRIDLEVQATVSGGDTEYDPLFLGIDGIPCWPTEPLWGQLLEAKEIQACKNSDLESWWTDWHGKQGTLTKGTDFDIVVLGISLGAHKYICQELITASKRWSDFVANVELVRTQGLQLWLNRDLPGVGWNTGPGILCGYTEPFDTWSDMAQLIPRERWTPADNVQQIAYFCNVIPDDPLAPFNDPTYPAKELQRAKDYARGFLDAGLLGIWPKAVDPKNPGHFDDAALVNCVRDLKQPNFDTQFFRVNIDPSELYVLSLPGTTAYRMPSGDSGFDNLFLAGDWTFTDINLGCIEAAVISGCMASRAICGQPEHIYGAFGSVIPIKKGGAGS